MVKVTQSDFQELGLEVNGGSELLHVFGTSIGEAEYSQVCLSEFWSLISKPFTYSLGGSGQDTIMISRLFFTMVMRVSLALICLGRWLKQNFNRCNTKKMVKGIFNVVHHKESHME